MELEITVSTVTTLIAEQFPQWSHLSITQIEPGGWDNRTFRLGTEMSIRLPSAQCYAAKVVIEQKWLPLLAPHITLRIPAPIAMGKPSKNYPYYWSIYRWIEGRSVNTIDPAELNLNHIAIQLAQFLNELHKIDIADGPLPGPHNFYRGGSLMVYDAETRVALVQLQDCINTKAATDVWEQALSSAWNKNPVWIHGDLSAGNILVKDKQLVAVIDFGGMGVGDPACDLVIAWTLLNHPSRKTFKEHMKLDNDTWARARGWALWKALITLASLRDQASVDALKSKQVIEVVIQDFRVH